MGAVMPRVLVVVVAEAAVGEGVVSVVTVTELLTEFHMMRLKEETQVKMINYILQEVVERWECEGWGWGGGRDEVSLLYFLATNSRAMIRTAGHPGVRCSTDRFV